MIKKLCSLLILAASIQTIGAASASAADSGSPYYYATDLALGYATTNNIASTATAPTILVYELSLLGLYKFNDMWSAGLSTDYAMINQTNDPGTKGTNYSGSRWNMLSPTLGYKNWGWLFLADYQFLGPWNLTNSNSSGKAVSYQSPSGLRLRGWMPLAVVPKMTVGGKLEYLNFSTLSATTDTTVNQMLWQAGVLVGYEF